MREILLVRFGEVFLKGQNRPFFMKKLMDHIRQAVRPVNGRVWMSEGRFYVSDFTDMDECIRRVTRVFGVHSVSPAIEMDKDNFEAICEQAARMMEPLSGTFKVLARRSDKRYPLDSPAIMREAGGYILDHVPQMTVDVNHPDHTMMIEIRDHAYLSVKRIPAVEGMPMGTNGKACLLLSGGIDSPVAGFMIAKRGVELCCVHYHSFPYTSERAREKVLELARLLSEYCGKMRVHVVPFTEIQMQIHAKCPENYTTLIMRRYMMRGIDKPTAIQMLLRAMSPQAIFCDEIGDMRDVRALLDAARCGVGLAASAHAGVFDDVLHRPVLRALYEAGAFERYLLLGRHGKLAAAYDAEGKPISGGGIEHEKRRGDGHDFAQRDRLCGGGR